MENKIKTIFFGTHDFAANILQGLIDSPLFEIALVVTQPDQPVGRKQVLTPPAAKILAEKHGLTVDQPESLKNFQFSTGDFELAIVAQYGRIIPKNLVEAPKYGTLNVHTSLLPKYRGAAPIQTAIMNGEAETGVTIMKMDEGMDTGPILLQKRIAIHPDETYLDLDKRLASIGCEALLETIPPFISRELVPTPQNNEEATYTRILTREDGQINWQNSEKEIYNQYRGLTPWPGIWTTLEEKRLKLLKIRPTDEILSPGLVSIQGNRILIGAGEKSVEVLSLQLEGKPAMEAKVFVNGYKDIDGKILKV